MQNLPVETLLQIFQLACTDGGCTGCSLSETSRAVRAASQSVRFYSIALFVDFYRLESFITSYRQLGSFESDSRAKVVHLHLEGAEEDADDADFEEDDSHMPNYRQAVRLLHLVADDLVSLVLPSMLMRSPPPGDVRLTDRSFSSLRALTVNVPVDRTGASVLYDFAVPPLFPILTHVHTVMAPGSRGLSVAALTAWNTHAPRATHLRISFCPLDGSAMWHMRLLLQTPTYPGKRPMPMRPPPSTRAWPSVRHVAIQPLCDHGILSPPRQDTGPTYWNLRSGLSWMVEWAKKEKTVDSARILESRPSMLCPSPTRISWTSREWRAAVREAWEMVVTSGVDSDWLTLGEKDELPLL